MSGSPAVFIDRDGTLIQERHYLSDPDGVVLIPGTVEALEGFERCGFTVVVVTNQSGIARGLYSLEDYHRVAARLMNIFETAGVAPAGVEFCPHHPDDSGPCDCRKPDAGLYRRAAKRLDLDLAKSFYVGDKLSDVAVVSEVGGTGILVRTGYGREHEASVDDSVQVVDDLLAAARFVRGLADRSDSVDPKIAWE